MGRRPRSGGADHSSLRREKAVGLRVATAAACHSIRPGSLQEHMKPPSSDAMTSVAKKGLVLVAAVAVGAVFVLASSRLFERQRTAEEINRLREELYRARVAADRCRGTLQTSEAALRSLGVTIDSLKNRVDSFEAMDGRGVPTGRYEEYLGVFDSYNDSVDVWGGRERRLRASEVSCRAAIEEHNALSDSLQAVLSEAGIDSG